MSDTVTVSPKYQVVIPRRIRESLGIEPGQKLQAMLYAGRIELVPVRSMRDARGLFPGLDPSIERDADRL
jgi:AbrB family looped-hinge helix DNA binding protein